jgi:hypothetical protein
MSSERYLKCVLRALDRVSRDIAKIKCKIRGEDER